MERFDLSKYSEVCPECDGWELRFSDSHEEDNKLFFKVTCLDCGADWGDFVD